MIKFLSGMCCGGTIICLLFVSVVGETADTGKVRAARLQACNEAPWPKPGHCAQFTLNQPSNIGE